MTPILLDAYAAKRCARRVHNEWDPTLEAEPWVPSAELQMRFEAGREFEQQVAARLRQALGERCVDLSQHGSQATLDAMDAGIEVILGGTLPDDLAGGRAGRPDVLLRHPAGGYVPGDIKHHLMAKRAKGTLRFSRPQTPGQVEEASGLEARTSQRFDDQLQLAHYWRMLEACGRAAGVPATGFVIGTDDLGLDPLGFVLIWLDLTAPLFSTFSRSRGTAKRSALERYDHEQGFRLKVATASAAGEPALVEPIFVNECDSCPWHDYCHEITDDDVASKHITSGRLDIREWKALRALGVHSLDELAALDPTDAGFLARYLPEVTHQKGVEQRLADAVRRAGMLRDGVQLVRTTTGPLALPRAEVEIDFDIEWDPDARVYLWGALVNRGGEASYQPVVSWSDEVDERALAEEFVAWLRGLVAEAAERGERVLVYHYSDVEPKALVRLLGKAEIADVLAHFVDLLAIVREHFFGLEGLGLKKVAPALGFAWRDEDPGGLQSQVWLQQARDEVSVERDASRARILAYNEDDVLATAVVREGLAES